MKNLFKSKNASASAVGALMDVIEQQYNAGSYGTAYGSMVASTESWSDPEKASAMSGQIARNQQAIEATVLNGHVAAIESFMGAGALSSNDWLTRHQVRVGTQAAALALEIAKDPFKYREASDMTLKAGLESAKNVNYIADYTVGERASAMDILPNYAASNEAFSSFNLAQAMSLSVTYNLAQAVQDPAIELFYRTVVMAPDEPCFFYEIAVDRYYDGYIHNKKKKKADVHIPKNLLMDAIRDPSLLQRDVLNVVPFFQEAGEGENTDQFMPKEIMPEPIVRRVAGVDIPTKPLKVGQDYDLLEISMHPGLSNGGIFDETDSLDSYVAVGNFYLSLNKNEAGKEGGVIKLPLAGLEQRNFTKRIQGHGMDMDLNFQSSEFVLTEDTVDLTGAKPAALKALTDAGYGLRLEVVARGAANIESGFYKIQHTEVHVVSAVKIEKNDQGKVVTRTNVNLDDAVLTAELEKLNLAVNYFDPETNRTNENLRTQGLLLDRDVYTSKFAIGIRSPVRYQRKVGTNESNQDIIEALLRFTRVRQTADGFYELFRFRDTLKQYQSDIMRDDTRIPDYIGVAKFMVKPHYRHIKLNIAEMAKTLDSKDALDNAREYLVGVLQEAAADALTSSNWMIAAVQQNNGQAVTPHFGIMCGQYLPLLLSVRGDLRLLGANFEHTVKTTYNKVMDERIFMTLVEKDKEGLQPLGFGNTFYYPETVISVSPHQMNGATKETHIVQPRYQHVSHLPILIEIEVEGLREYINNYNLVKVKLADIDSGNLAIDTLATVAPASGSSAGGKPAAKPASGNGQGGNQ